MLACSSWREHSGERRSVFLQSTKTTGVSAVNVYIKLDSNVLLVRIRARDEADMGVLGMGGEWWKGRK